MKGATPTDLRDLAGLFKKEGIPFSELAIGEWYSYSDKRLSAH